MSDIRLVVFDVDGTLVDSQADIVASMEFAFTAVDLPKPSRQTVLSIVGLSLDQAMQHLAPDANHSKMVEAYKSSYMDLRAENGKNSSPLYPGARQVLDYFQKQDDVVLGIATGKSKRGLDRLIESHDLGGIFVTQQVADFHPSKPHPSMLLKAMADVGVGVQDAVMIGDTTFDMDMAAAAGIPGIGVSWGYHPVDQLVSAKLIVDDFEALPHAVNSVQGI